MENIKLNLRSSVITPRPFPYLLAWFRPSSQALHWVSLYNRVQSENGGHCSVFVYFLNKIGMLNVSYGICDVSIHLLADVYIFLSLTRNNTAADVFACSF